MGSVKSWDNGRCCLTLQKKNNYINNAFLTKLPVKLLIKIHGWRWWGTWPVGSVHVEIYRNDLYDWKYLVFVKIQQVGLFIWIICWNKISIYTRIISLKPRDVKMNSRTEIKFYFNLRFCPCALISELNRCFRAHRVSTSGSGLETFLSSNICLQ